MASVFDNHPGIRILEQTKRDDELRAAQSLIESKRKQEEKAAQKHGRLTPSQWREIEMLWESGEVTLSQLSEKYGKHIDTFVAHFKKNGNQKGSRKEELRKIAQEAAKKQARNEAEVISERIRKTKEEHYKMSEAIAKLTFDEILKVRQSDGQFRSIKQDISALLLAAETLKKVREERWVVLGLDKDVIDEDALPELVMSTMTDEQVQELRNMQDEDETEMGVNVSGMAFGNDREEEGKDPLSATS